MGSYGGFYGELLQLLQLLQRCGVPAVAGRKVGKPWFSWPFASPPAEPSRVLSAGARIFSGGE